MEVTAKLRGAAISAQKLVWLQILSAANLLRMLLTS